MPQITVSLSDATRNFTALIADATKEDYAAGMKWYTQAHNDCRLLSEDTGVTLDTACQVVAATSPFTLWEKNVGAARNIIKHWQAGGDEDSIPKDNGTRYYANARKAFNILAGNVTLQSKAIKTFNFYKNMLDPTQGENMTIDFHMVCAATGDKIMWKDMQKNLSLPKSAYATLCSALVSTATNYGILPLQAQAIVWIAQKRRKEEQGGK